MQQLSGGVDDPNRCVPPEVRSLLLATKLLGKLLLLIRVHLRRVLVDERRRLVLVGLAQDLVDRTHLFGARHPRQVALALENARRGQSDLIIKERQVLVLLGNRILKTAHTVIN